MATLAGDDESEEKIDDEEKHPEVDLREEQRVVVVEGEERSEVCEYVGQGAIVGLGG